MEAKLSTFNQKIPLIFTKQKFTSMLFGSTLGEFQSEIGKLTISYEKGWKYSPVGPDSDTSRMQFEVVGRSNEDVEARRYKITGVVNMTSYDEITYVGVIDLTFDDRIG